MKDQRGGKQVMRVSSSENTLLVKVTQLFYAFSLFLVFCLVLFCPILSLSGAHTAPTAPHDQSRSSETFAHNLETIQFTP